MHLLLRSKRLIGPFLSQLILLAAGLLLTVSPGTAEPVHTIGRECDPAATTARWSQATNAGPTLTSVIANTAVPGIYSVRGHGFTAGGVVEIVAYDTCSVDRHVQGQTVATNPSLSLADALEGDVMWPEQDGLVIWSFTAETNGPLTVRAHDVASGAWTNVILVDVPAAERTACDRDCHRARGIESTP